MPASDASSVGALRRKAAGRRTFSTSVEWSPETREASDGTLILRGLAAVFDSESHDLGGFTETLAPGCFTRALGSPGSDQFLLWSHDPDAILARRSAGTLDLRETDRGLEIEARLVPTQLAKDVHLLVKTGHADGMSFGFTVGRDQWTGSGKTTRRRITEVASLFEVTVTPNPAYPAAGATARSRDQLASELEAMKGRARKLLADNTTKRGNLTMKKKVKNSPTIEVGRTRSPYGPGSPHSYFRDLIATQTQRLHVGTDTPTTRMREQRAATDAPGSGGDFLPSGAIPAPIAEAFGIAARARAVVAPLLPTTDLPDAIGTEIKVPRFTSQGTAAPQVAGTDSIASSSPATGASASQVVTIAGQIEVQRSAFERAVPHGFDQAIGAELGAALAEQLDLQILNGPGTSHQLTGLLSQAGTSSTYSSSTPTVAGVVSRIGENLAGVHTAAGEQPDQIIMHPRRYFWLQSQADTAGQPVELNVGASMTASAAMPLDGNGRDQILTLSTNGVRLFLAPPTVQVAEDYAGTDKMQVKVYAYQYAALSLPRGTGSVGKITGTGLAAPTFA